MRFLDLDDITRHYMLDEFEAEERSGRPYRSARLSPEGIAVFPTLLAGAIRSGDERTLIDSLMEAHYWKNVNAGGRRINIRAAAEDVGLTEFVRPVLRKSPVIRQNVAKAL